jgi:hypothetical protein
MIRFGIIDDNDVIYVRRPDQRDHQHAQRAAYRFR